MAIVSIYSKAARDPSTGKTPKAINVQGSVKSLFGTVAVGSTDSIGSKYYVGKLPSKARILSTSMVRCTAITSAAMNLGFDIANKGAVLLSAQTIATAANLSAVTAVGTANLGKFAWELAGYTADPGTEIMIVGELTAAATAAGTLVFDLQYTV